MNKINYFFNKILIFLSPLFATALVYISCNVYANCLILNYSIAALLIFFSIILYPLFFISIPCIFEKGNKIKTARLFLLILNIIIIALLIYASLPELHVIDLRNLVAPLLVYTLIVLPYTYFSYLLALWSLSKKINYTYLNKLKPSSLNYLLFSFVLFELILAPSIAYATTSNIAQFICALITFQVRGLPQETLVTYLLSGISALILLLLGDQKQKETKLLWLALFLYLLAQIARSFESFIYLNILALTLTLLLLLFLCHHFYKSNNNSIVDAILNTLGHLIFNLLFYYPILIIAVLLQVVFPLSFSIPLLITIYSIAKVLILPKGKPEYEAALVLFIFSVILLLMDLIYIFSRIYFPGVLEQCLLL